MRSQRVEMNCFKGIGFLGNEIAGAAASRRCCRCTPDASPSVRPHWRHPA